MIKSADNLIGIGSVSFVFIPVPTLLKAMARPPEWGEPLTPKPSWDWRAATAADADLAAVVRG